MLIALYELLLMLVHSFGLSVVSITEFAARQKEFSRHARNQIQYTPTPAEIHRQIHRQKVQDWLNSGAAVIRSHGKIEIECNCMTTE